MSLSDVRLTLVESLDDVGAFLRWLSERRPVLALDIETSGLSLASDRIRLVQFGDGAQGWAVPWDEWRGVIRHALATYEGPLVLQHAKFDAGFLTREGVPFPWHRVHDTMIMAFLTDSMGPKSLKAAAARYVDPAARAGEQELKRAMARNRWGYGDVPIGLDLYWGYAAMDTVLTARLAEQLWPRVQYAREAYDLELACERVLHDIEQRGVPLDVAYCQERRAELRDDLSRVLEELGEVNPFAPVQVAEALQAAGAVLVARTATGQLSVTDEVLSQVAHPIAAAVLRARGTQKVLTSYFENFLAYNDGGRLHPHINQLQAKTGRMSVTEPALQTLPRTPLVRDAFIPSEGNVLALVDYDNQELRVAAHISGDADMITVLREGRDLHAEAARRLYGEGYTAEQRTTAKNARFSKLYGAGIPKFARTAGVPEYEAAKVFAVLEEMNPQLGRTAADVTRAVRERAAGGEFGYVVLSDGRHLKVFADKAYVGFNARIQGECAVVLKRALVDLDAAGFGPYLVLPVHDEVMFDLPERHAAEMVGEIRAVMTREEFAAPLTVGAEIVHRWGDKYRKEDK